MDLATPAPRVSAAAADSAKHAKAADVEPAVPRRSPDVEPAKAVRPATTVDDPMQHAPREKIEEKHHLEERVSVNTLRGTSGADFESRAAVLRGVKEKNCLASMLPCIFDERDFVAYGEVQRYIVVKGENCFVFTEENDPSPLYAISLYDKTPQKEDPENPEGTSLTISPSFNNICKGDLDTVLLKDRASGKIAYQFTFNTTNEKGVADRFFSVANAVKRLHGDKTSSVVYAENVARAKEKNQPTDPNLPKTK